MDPHFYLFFGTATTRPNTQAVPIPPSSGRFCDGLQMANSRTLPDISLCNVERGPHSTLENHRDPDSRLEGSPDNVLASKMRLSDCVFEAVSFLFFYVPKIGASPIE